MTEDITRGLTRLADEAEPATVDADDVITRARARTRNRRATAATAFATVAVIGALVATLGNAAPPSKPATPASAAESLTGRLTRQLAEILPKAIPSDWTLVTKSTSDEPPLSFHCGVRVVPTSDGLEGFPNGCLAYAYYTDGVGEIQVNFAVHRLAENFDVLICAEPNCAKWEPPVRQELPDGTRTQVITDTEKATSRDSQQMHASRPDGTVIYASLAWPQGQRSRAPLTTDAILKFATAFTYRSEDVPPADIPKTDAQKAGRLTEELSDVLADIIPADWAPANEVRRSDTPPPTFDCRESVMGPGTGDGTPEDNPKTVLGCWASGYYQDAAGRIGLKFSVAPLQIFGGTCEARDCVKQTLPDGTRTQVKNEFHEPIAEYTHGVSAFRPDGTVIWVEVFWQGQRSQTPLTDQQLLKFATAFTY